MVARGADGKFTKGSSGNPGGRPVAPFTLPGLIDERVTRQDWIEMIDKLKDKAKRGDIKSLEMLMDRRWGKAIQAINQNNSGEVKIIVEYADPELETD